MHLDGFNATVDDPDASVDDATEGDTVERLAAALEEDIIMIMISPRAAGVGGSLLGEATFQWGALVIEYARSN